MASMRIPFPEQPEPTVVALTGARITIGRLPFNTVQIIDRIISGFHAELILENGHYRLHDRGSTNGTFVNGQPASDFHLREACKISFGTIECDFDPAAETMAAETVPTRTEMNAVRQENAELRGTLAAVREELAELLAVKPVDGAAPAVAREEFNRVVAEREMLKEARLRHDQEIARLQGELAVLRRDRENLQKAWDATKAELAKARRSVEAVAVMEVPAARAPAVAPAVAVPAPVPAPVSAPPPPVPTSRPAVPPTVPPAKPAVPPAPEVAASAPVSVPPPPPPPHAVPSRPAVAAAKPPAPTIPPTGRPFPGPKPAGPTVKLVPAPMPAAPGQQRSPMNIAVRPAPAAPPPAPAAAKVPASGIHPRTSVMPVHARAAGPKGTQRLG